MAKQTVTVSVLADTKPLSKAFRGLGDQLGLGKLARAAGKLGKAVAVGAAAGGVALGALGVKTVRAASDLQQSVGGVAAVFKDQAGKVKGFSDAAAQNLGLTKTQYNGLATIIGTTLKAAGTPLDELAGKTDKMVTRAADLAATFGGPVPEASNAMAAALRGEFEPLRRYGVSLSVADINARALADSGKSSAEALTKQEKAVATQALIMEQSADAAGQFARENDTLAGKVERLKAQLGNLAADLGTLLLPAATAVAGYLSDNLGPAVEQLGAWASDHLLPKLAALGEWFTGTGLPALSSFGEFIVTTVVPALVELGTWLQANVLPVLVSLGTFLVTTVVPALVELAGWVQSNSAWLIPLAAAVLGAVAGFRAFTIAMAAWKVITTAAAAAQVLLNLALAANPIGLVIAVVAGLVAGLVVLWKTNDGFRDAVKRAWSVISGSVQAAWRWLQTLPARFGTMMGDVRTRVSDGITAVVDFFAQLPVKVGTWLVKMAGRLEYEGRRAMAKLEQRVDDGIDAVLDFFRNLPSRIVSALGSLGGTLSGAAGELIDGFLGGIQGGFDRVRSKLGELTNLLPSWKGPARRDRKLLEPAGRLIIGGLVNGLRRSFPEVRRALGQLTRDMADTDMPTLTAGVDLAATGQVGLRPAQAPRPPVVVHLEVNTLAGGPETGRHIVAALQDYLRVNGGGRVVVAP